jgi:hypothetical protein
MWINVFLVLGVCDMYRAKCRYNMDRLVMVVVLELVADN